ncbi:MAG: ribosome biogenesis GTPase YlqF [Bacillales bacterium]
MQNIKNIHWFPGHMKKAINKIIEQLKLVDFVIIVLDSRIPISSNCNYIDKLLGDKKRLYLLTKSDLSDDIETSKWIEYFSKNENRAIAIDLTKQINQKTLLNECKYFSILKREKYLKKGIKNINTRCMILGIPNVGKSTLINLLANKKITQTANKPGVTRNIRWVKLGDFEFLDVPGILEPNYDNSIQALNLASIGSIKEEILPLDDVVTNVINILKKYYYKEFNDKYNLDCLNENNNEILLNIAKQRGFINKGNIYDIDKAKSILLNEFRNGKICKVSIERIE